MRRLAMFSATTALFSGCVLPQPGVAQQGKNQKEAQSELEKAWEEVGYRIGAQSIRLLRQRLTARGSGMQPAIRRTYRWPQAQGNRRMNLNLMESDARAGPARDSDISHVPSAYVALGNAP